ncbi:MAG: hypothetical protein PHC85_02585 [Candidatus Pacebacteria bacterium]|nr:hypothetical protein [Candidatus Paceibacterota bacterium]
MDWLVPQEKLCLYSDGETVKPLLSVEEIESSADFGITTEKLEELTVIDSIWLTELTVKFTPPTVSIAELLRITSLEPANANTGKIKKEIKDVIMYDLMLNKFRLN